MEKDLPKGWAYTTVDKITASLEIGGRPKGGAGDLDEGIPSISAEHFNYGGKFKFEKLKFIDESFFSTLKKGKIRNSDILIVKDGATTGKSAFIDESFPFSEAAVNEHTFILRTKDNFIPKLFFYFTLSPEFSNHILNTKGGSTIGGIKTGFINELKIPLPPLPEQERIVAKLDSIFAHLEVAKQGLEKIPVLLKEFRQAVLTQAVTGKLTEEWREGKELVKPSVFIDAIIEKRKTLYNQLCELAKNKGERRPSKMFLDKLPEIDEIAIDLPESWFQTNLHFLSFITKLAGFEYTEHFNLKDSGDIPVVRAQNVQMGRFEDKNRLFLAKETSDYLTRSQLHGREILMVFIGAGTGNVCLAPKHERWHLAPNVAKIDVDGVSTEYLYLYLQSPLGVENVLSRVKATAQPSLSMETIRDIVTLVPSLSEQTEIVRRVEALFSKADAIEAQYKKLKEQIEQLPQAILAKTFRGEV